MSDRYDIRKSHASQYYKTHNIKVDAKQERLEAKDAGRARYLTKGFFRRRENPKLVASIRQMHFEADDLPTRVVVVNNLTQLLTFQMIHSSRSAGELKKKRGEVADQIAGELVKELSKIKLPKSPTSPLAAGQLRKALLAVNKLTGAIKALRACGADQKGVKEIDQKLEPLQKLLEKLSQKPEVLGVFDLRKLRTTLKSFATRGASLSLPLAKAAQTLQEAIPEQLSQKRIIADLVAPPPKPTSFTKPPGLQSKELSKHQEKQVRERQEKLAQQRKKDVSAMEKKLGNLLSTPSTFKWQVCDLINLYVNLETFVSTHRHAMTPDQTPLFAGFLGSLSKRLSRKNALPLAKQLAKEIAAAKPALDKGHASLMGALKEIGGGRPQFDPKQGILDYAKKLEKWVLEARGQLSELTTKAEFGYQLLSKDVAKVDFGEPYGALASALAMVEEEGESLGTRVRDAIAKDQTLKATVAESLKTLAQVDKDLQTILGGLDASIKELQTFSRTLKSGTLEVRLPFTNKTTKLSSAKDANKLAKQIENTTVALIGTITQIRSTNIRGIVAAKTLLTPPS